MDHDELKKKATNTHRAAGDSLQGEHIIAHARTIIKKKRPSSGTSTHKIQEVVLKKNVLCVIEKTFRIVRNSNSSQDKTEPADK